MKITDTMAKVFLAASFMLPTVAMADTLTWNGGASGSFSTGPWTSDGSHTMPQNGDTLVFGTGGTLENDISGLSVAGLSFTSSSAVTLTGSQIAIANGGALSVTGTGPVTNSVPLVLGTAATPAVSIDVATSCALAVNACLSGPADIVYGEAVTGGGYVYLLVDNDYTGNTVIKHGTVDVYADMAFGTTDGNTGIVNPDKGYGIIRFYSVTMSENFDHTCNHAVDKPKNNTKPIQFYGVNVFNGTWRERGLGFYYADPGVSVTFNGIVTYDQWDSNYATYRNADVYYNAEGSILRHDHIYGGNLHYNSKCKASEGIVIGYATYGGSPATWVNPVQTRYFNCENAMLYDPTYAVPIQFNQNSCVADMCGYDQTFRHISCPQAYDSSEVRSAGPSAVHLLLNSGTANVLCHAKFTGQVSLSFEGSRPMSLGNANNTSTGSLSLTNASSVTLLDNFKWCGSSVTVSDGSTLTIGNATFPEALAVAVNDRAASGGDAAVASKIVLNDNVAADTLSINGRKMGGGRTYGATGSGADIVDDDHFAGTGVLSVRHPTGLILIVR